MIYRKDGKKWVDLPTVVYVTSPRFYRVLGFRAPKKGEWYLSGNLVDVYWAFADFDDEYLVIELKERAVRRCYWARQGEST